MDHGAKPSFSAVCSPPLALLYKNRKKGKPSFTLDVDLDEELCDALCKISKSSEELWKEISPPSPIGSKANTSADWMSLDAAVQHAANQNSHIPRIEVDGPPDDSSSPFEATSRYNPANYNNHLSRVSGRGSSSNLLSTGILPLKAASTTPSSLSHHPPPSILHSSSEQPLSLPAPSSSPMSSTSTQLPVFSSAFANYANPSFNHHNNMDAFHNHGPSVTTNSISISGNSNMNNQNSSSSHSSNSSPHISSHQTSPPIQPLSPLPQSPTKKEPRKTSAQFSAPYTSPQLKIHQYVPPGAGAEESPFSGGTHKNNTTNNNNNNHNSNNHNNHTNNNSSNNSNNSNSNNADKNHDKMRNHENEKLWSEVVLNCNKLKAHASRGVAQTLSWNEINDAMNSTRSVMGSLLSLLQLHSNAYANIYNSVPGYHAPENGSNPFGDVPNQFMRFASPQFDPFGHHAHQFNNMSMSMPMPMSMSMNMNTPSPVEVKKENNSPNVDNFHAPYNTTPPLAPFGYEDNHRANKMPRRESVNHGTPETLSRSESTPNMSGNMPLSPLQNVMSLPNLNLSPVITALSNLQSSSLSNSTDSITGNGSSSDEAPSHTPTRSYPTPTPTSSTTATTPPEPAPTGGKSGNWNKKNRGKKRSKYADLDLMCLSCGVKQTPEWRRGPAGAKTLCNACGLHWAKVLKAEGKSGVATDSKKAFLLEQKKNQFMLLAKKDGSRHKD